MQDIIYINNIPTKAIIGVHEYEKKMPQKLIVSLELGTEITQAAKTDDLAYALNYDAISRFVDQTVQSSQFELLESLAQHVVDELFAQFEMTSIRLNLQKPGAIGYTQQVGLIIYRERD